MTYIGIDQSFSRTGMVAIDQAGEVLIVASAEPRDTDDNGIRRIVAEVIDFSGRVFKVYDKMQTFCIETPTMSKHGSRAYQQLCCLFGVLRYEFRAREVNPRSWQSKIMHNRLRGINKRTKAGATEYLEQVYIATGHHFTNPDIADAYCIAEYSRRLDMGLVSLSKKSSRPRGKTQQKTE